MSQSQPITISNFQRGVASSPFVGFGKMVGLDIFKKPGVIQCGGRLVNTGVTFTGLITAQAIAPDGTIFQGSSDGKVYRNGVVIASNRGIIHDIVVYKDYAIISKNTASLDLFGQISGAGTYTNDWRIGLEVSVFGWKKMVIGKDNVVYLGNETKLASITGFGGGGGSLNTQILLTGIFNNKYIQTISEYNRYLAIMTSPGSGNYGFSTLYFMDRGTVDPSQTSFSVGIGVDIPERNVNQMIIKDNRLYFFGNDTGTFYETNQVTWTPIVVLPNRLILQSYLTFPNAISLLDNQIVIGIGGYFNSAFDVVYGVYGIQGNSLICKSIVSSGEYGQNSNVSIGSIISGGSVDGYYASWQTGSTYGVDQVTSYIGTGFNSWFESPFYETGTAIKPRTFQTVQFNLANNLVDGQRLRLKYRIASNDLWTTFAIYEYMAGILTITYFDGSLPSSQSGTFNTFHSKFPITGTTNIQIRVEFDTGISPLYGSNIELQSITLI